MTEPVSIELTKSWTHPNLIQRFARAVIPQKLWALQKGRLVVREGQRVMYFPETTVAPGPEAEVRIHHPHAYVQTMLGGTLGFAEALVEGVASTPDPVALARLFVVNRDAMNGIEGGLAKLRAPLEMAAHALNRNTQEGSIRNIRAHYDLGNDFFSLFLDATMMYSSALFPSEEATLHQAQLHRLDRICDKLELSERDHLLEIGTGWGGLAIHAAQRTGCHVTTTTISQEQYDLAVERVRDAGLQDQVKVLLRDYRVLEGQFDKIVSVEMIEAIGHQFFDTYFARCSHLLKPEGMFLLQAITIEDRFYESARDSVDFIKRHIFPGCCIPSTSIITDSVARSSDMKLYHFEDFGPHYARTLRIWRERLNSNTAAARQQGLSASFLRKWDWYFAYCEAGFEERLLGVTQMLFVKPECRRGAFLG